ncbi:hypothetical protein GCK32_000018 [Trichostrongylus colubriformis]|uniref:Organic solute transporter subunit alpha n=1 Tax=Trichostrongylus colubriformis TaxID=6319 RepID=A0AAN8FSF5_TRICO
MSGLNCSESFPIPDMYTMYKNFTYTQFILFAIAGALNIAVLFVGILHIINIWKYVNDEKMRSKLYILSLLFPVLVSLDFVSMISPRSFSIFSSIGVLYILFCMYTVTSLCRFIYGSREQLSSALTSDEAIISLQVPPCCCCMPCLPKAKPSERNLKIVECLTLQGPIVRAFLIVLNCHFVAEKWGDSEHLLKMTELAGLLSLLFTIFGAHIMGKLTAVHLQKYKVMSIFRFVDITMALFTAQLPLIFELILVKYGVINCGPILSAMGNAKFICNFVVICELSLLSLLATRLLLPEKCALFDKSPERLLEIARSAQEKMLPKDY